jgi:hypothetical protein
MLALGRFGVLVINLHEARGLALGFNDGLLAIGLGRLDDLRRFPARLGNDTVGVGLRLGSQCTRPSRPWYCGSVNRSA